MILLLDIIIVILGHIFVLIDLIAMINTAFIFVILNFSCLIYTGGIIHRFLSEIDSFHGAVEVQVGCLDVRKVAQRAYM